MRSLNLGWTRAADRLVQLAFGLLAVVPLGMALLNRSAPVLVVAAALAAAFACILRGEGPALGARLRELARAPLGRATAAFLGFAAIAILWSGHPRVSGSAFGELVLAGAAAILLHAALPRAIPDWAVKLATIAVALGCLAIMSELASGMSARGALGLRTDTFIFKRSVTAILIGLWPLATLLWLQGKAPVAVASLVLLALASMAAHSSATLLGLAAGAGAAGLAVFSRRVAGAGFVAFFLAAFAVAPVLGDAADRLLPPRFVEAIAAAHARERIDIWQSFGEVVRRRPLLGEGFGTSPVMNREPVADEVPPERRLMLGAWHPHNGYLQVWSEMGLVGALLACATLAMVARALGRATRPQAAAGAATLGSAAIIMLVGHGAWQGWWIAVLGAAAIWIARLPAAATPRPARPPPRRPRP